MSAITLFTTHLDVDSELFGKGNERNNRFPIINDEIVQFFHLDDQMRIIWNSLNEEYKKEAILESGLTKNPLLLWLWIKRANDEEKDTLETIWKSQKNFILEHTHKIFEWSIYKAHNMDDVYAMNALKKRKNIVTWTKELVSIAKILKPDASIVNLVLHEKDIIRDNDMPLYVYEEAELSNAFGKDGVFKRFKNDSNIEQINVILFQHSSPAGMRLLKNPNLKDVHKEVREILDEANKAKKEARERGLPEEIVKQINSKKKKKIFFTISQK